MWRLLKGLKLVTSFVLLALLLAHIGEPYRLPGENHTAVYFGVRHIWRFTLQGCKDIHRAFRECKADGKPSCAAQAVRQTVSTRWPRTEEAASNIDPSDCLLDPENCELQ